MNIRATYEAAFAQSDDLFLTWYPVDSTDVDIPRCWTRGEFMHLVLKMGAALQEHGCEPGDRVALCMGSNQIYDLAIRAAAAFTGIIPVTVNWQADTFDAICYKIQVCRVKLIIFDDVFNQDLRKQIEYKFLNRVRLQCNEMAESTAIMNYYDVEEEDTRIIIFTSGTTGKPKGVALPYRSYRCNRQTFEQFLDINESDHFALCCVNPLHHTNSTAMSDWALRRPGTQLHLIERYSSTYWQTIVTIESLKYDRIIAPVVSRHFDFYEHLVKTDTLTISADVFKRSAKHVEFLLGSAPVGPQTVERLQTYADQIPHIRFGSTETCLQVIGTPVFLDAEQKKHILQQGWQHQWNGEDQCGYWIGRDHQPFNQVKIVRSINKKENDFMQECQAGEPGYCITRGDNLMSHYIDNPEATSRAFHDGWYLGLGDIVFYLENENARDFYWQSRVANLLIRGGSNYSCEYIGSLVTRYLDEVYNLDSNTYDCVVIGIRLHSEHEDSCCVVLELKDECDDEMKERIEATFFDRLDAYFTKGCKPDVLLFESIPRNFKGALLPKVLKELALQVLRPVP